MFPGVLSSDRWRSEEVKKVSVWERALESHTDLFEQSVGQIVRWPCGLHYIITIR